MLRQGYQHLYNYMQLSDVGNSNSGCIIINSNLVRFLDRKFRVCKDGIH
jgi:hypothetical protein